MDANIYTLSRLYKKQPTRWVSILQEIERGRDIMPKQYSPLRNAIVAEVNRPGSGRKLLEVGLASMRSSGSQASIVNKSRAAFDTFLQGIAPELASLEDNFLQPNHQPAPIPFGHHNLTGRFHFSARTHKDEVVYVYLHPSRWDADEIEAYVELLALIAEHRHDADRAQVWFARLQGGQVLRPAKYFKRTRNELAKTLDLLARLTEALFITDPLE